MKHLLIILLVILVSCRGKKEEAIDLQDIIDYDTGSDAVDTVNTGNDLNGMFVQMFRANGIETEIAVPLSDKMFPDRFGPDSTIAFELGNDSVSYTYHRWIYSDSVKTMNAFYNWIDCFGKECNSFYLGEEVNFQPNSFVLLVGSENLIFVEGSTQRSDSWISLHDSLGLDKNWTFIIDQKKRGKAYWYTIEDEKKVKFER